jgi:transcriptional regulator with XRE-family HTH domain
MKDGILDSLSRQMMAFRGDVPQKRFAAMLGISAQYLCDVEHGRRGLTPEMCDRLARRLALPESRRVHLHVLAARHNGYLVPLGPG